MSHHCFQLTQHDTNFRFEMIDVLQPMSRRAFVVRAMNIVTVDNFSTGQARIAVRNCVRAVELGGFLIMGRSPSLRPHNVQATIFGIDQGGARVLKRLNGGCELESMVLEEGVHAMSLGDTPVRPSNPQVDVREGYPAMRTGNNELPRW
jgi:hypothetical protein